MLEIKEGLVSGEEIHKTIESKNKNYSLWVRRVIDYADLINDKDFFTKVLKSTGGRPKQEILFTINAAKEICLLERNAKGKQIRRWLISIGNKHESGLAFTAQQITALMDLSKSMTLVSIQKEVERKHFDLYNNRFEWYQYRADLLGYSKDSIIEAMRLVNKKYKTIRKSLIKLDANELIRSGVIDLMMALGKTQEYSTNVGNLCKEMAEKMELGKLIWDDTKPDSLGLNKPFVSQNKELYTGFETKQLK